MSVSDQMSSVGDDEDTVSNEELLRIMQEQRDQLNELSDQLADERQKRQQLEQELESRPDVEFGTPGDIKTLRIGSIPVGKIIEAKADGSDLESNQDMIDDLWDVVMEGDEASGAAQSQSRESMLPIQRMYVDMQSGAESSLNKSQKRAATLYGAFEKKVREGGTQGVTPDGQKYTMNTEQAVDVLEDAGLLADLKKQSYPKTAGRVMRDVQRFTIVDGEEHQEHCSDIDKCSDHGLFQFRAGKPSTLTVPKANLEANLRNAVMTQSDKSVKPTDDGESARNSPEEGSHGSEMDALTQASAVNDDD